MVCRFSLYASRRQRLADFLAGQQAGSPPVGWAIPPKDNDYEADFGEDTHGVEGELDQAHASYGRACAWAWPYVNLRPLCHQPGFEADTILNPFLPVPKIRLSEASPDYKETVAALRNWEPKIGNAHARLKDLYDDRSAAVAATGAVAAAGPQGKLDAEKALSEDPRLAEMFKIYQQIKPALRRWRKDQHKIEALAEPWYIANATLAALQVQAQEIQGQINLLALQAQNPKADQVAIQLQAQALQNQLIALQPQIAATRQRIAAIENQVRELRADQGQLAGQSEASMEAWVHLCDVLGRLGPAAHKKALPLLDQWIAEEPRLWQPYLARGAARLHAGQHDPALADLKRVESKLRLYDSRPRPLALITAVQAYALCKQDDACQKRQGDRLFTEAKKLDKQSWAVCLVRGWSYLERGKYPAAKADFLMALSLSKKTPQAEAHEAMALLLAACPNERVRDGDKAVEQRHQTPATWRTGRTGFASTRWVLPTPRRAISTRRSSGQTRRWRAPRRKAKSQYANASRCIRRRNHIA